MTTGQGLRTHTLPTVALHRAAGQTSHKNGQLRAKASHIAVKSGSFKIPTASGRPSGSIWGGKKPEAASKPEGVPTRTSRTRTHSAHTSKGRAPENATTRQAHTQTRTHTHAHAREQHAERAPPPPRDLIDVAWQGASRAPGCKRVP